MNVKAIEQAKEKKQRIFARCNELLNSKGFFTKKDIMQSFYDLSESSIAHYIHLFVKENDLYRGYKGITVLWSRDKAIHDATKSKTTKKDMVYEACGEMMAVNQRLSKPMLEKTLRGKRIAPSTIGKYLNDYARDYGLKKIVIGTRQDFVIPNDNEYFEKYQIEKKRADELQAKLDLIFEITKG